MHETKMVPLWVRFEDGEPVACGLYSPPPSGPLTVDLSEAVRSLEEAEPAPPYPDWPVLGDRVYVDEPRIPIRGWATVTRVTTDLEIAKGHKVLVDPENRWESPRSDYQDHARWLVRPAACHREEPQTERPGEGAVFLGRYDVSDTPENEDGPYDFWWFDGRVRRAKRSLWFFTEDIDKGVPLPGLLRGYRPALSRARALGLCPPAEKIESEAAKESE